MIFSPSKTEAYDACSLKGKLMYKDKWEPREANNGTVGRIAGTCFAKGTELIHTGHDDYSTVSARLWDRTVQWYVDHGVSFAMDLPKARGVLLKTLDKYAKENPFATWQFKAAELTLVDYGNCRLDYLGIDPEGYWSIADLKYKRTLPADYLNKSINEYRDSWQFQHYPWGYNDWLVNKGKMTTFEPATRIWLCLVIAEPFKIHMVPFFVNPKLQLRWVDSAYQKWADISAIENGTRQPTMAAVHRDQYGDCPMKEACLEMDLDPSLMAFKYVQVPRLPDEV